MANLEKPTIAADANYVLQNTYNPGDDSITVSSFVSSKVGNRITRTLTNSTTEDYSFYDGANLLYTIRVVYTSDTLETISSVERTV